MKKLLLTLSIACCFSAFSAEQEQTVDVVCTESINVSHTKFSNADEILYIQKSEHVDIIISRETAHVEIDNPKTESCFMYLDNARSFFLKYPCRILATAVSLIVTPIAIVYGQQPHGHLRLMPTSVPSPYPTVLPTWMPTSQPSSQPSSQPTASPTWVPTSQPSSQPSAYPTVLPTWAPTSQPSSQPSAYPTVLPTWAPTFYPTPNPSFAPTFLPSSNPSAWPTSRPTYLPSGAPTFYPTPNPSLVPTFLPSSNPSAWPTTNPSAVPTVSLYCKNNTDECCKVLMKNGLYTYGCSYRDIFYYTYPKCGDNTNTACLNTLFTKLGDTDQYCIKAYYC